jgi:hypothetical protein
MLGADGNTGNWNQCGKLSEDIQGEPGGWATPSDFAATINSPLSISVTVGASVKL